ncbi:MAG: FAD-dependent oxidoreductase [Isosphaeraceae bacterium]
MAERTVHSQMWIRRGCLIALGLWTAGASGRAEAAEAKQADVVVYGGTSAGVIAAIASAREGKSVVLLEPGKHLGGMVSGGLGATDTGNRKAIGGYSLEFFQRIRAYYTEKYGKDSEQVRLCSDGFRFEPKVAEATFKAMLEETKVEVVFGARLDRIEKSESTIKVIHTTKGPSYAALVFIDASYEGDLMAAAGVRSTVGREGRDQYGETLAGVQAHSPSHQWPVNVSVFDDQGKLLPFVQPGKGGAAGAGDRKVQAYNYRLCMTLNKDNMVPFPKPEGYDPDRFELLARYLAKNPKVRVGQLMNPVPLPNGKTDTNNNGPFSTDHIGANWDYPEADKATRQTIQQDHITYTQGFLYFLANDPRVPKALHDEMNLWGLAKDEFNDTDHWPHQLYVREARRMLGAYIMTQRDIMEEHIKPDTIGLGSYNTDSHHVQRVANSEGFALNEGDFQIRLRPYAIPYRSLTPKAEECANLLTPICLSASHVAYGTIRMEPVYMILGQASGVAAALAVDGKTSVQDVPYEKLGAKLSEQKAVLSPEGLGGPALSRIDPKSLRGIVVDDSQASKTGNWMPSSSLSPFIGEGYVHDINENKGRMALKFTPELPRAGRYEVRLYAPSSPNRATNVPVNVHSADGERTLKIDQRKERKGGVPIVIGVFSFEAGATGWVEVRNEGTNGHVVVDALEFLPVQGTGEAGKDQAK